MKTIRLKAPIRVAHEIHPANAVFDATDEVADMLIEGKDGHSYADETDAIERYPIGQPLIHVDDWPVTGAEKFPIDPETQPTLTPAMFPRHVDRLVQEKIMEHGPTPPTTSKEPAPARVEVSAADRKRGEEEQRAAAEERVSGAQVVVAAKDTKAKS
jgi:hypothetical protein